MRGKSKEKESFKQSTKESCYELARMDFVNGMKLKAVADKYQIKYNTIWVWYSKNGWRHDKVNLGIEIFKANARMACEVVRLGLDNANRFIEFINDKMIQLEMLRAEDDENTPFDKHIIEYISLAKLATYAGNAYKCFNPEIGADVAQQILESLEQAKEKKNGSDT